MTESAEAVDDVELESEHEADYSKVPKRSKTLIKEEAKLDYAKREFDSFFSDQFGPMRWKEELLPCLLKDTRHCALLNKLTHPLPESVGFLGSVGAAPLRSVGIPCFVLPNGRFPSPPRDMNNILQYYILDAASLLAVTALDVQPDDRVLDVCAAPGGKSLAILQKLSAGGHLTSNDPSTDRRRRLQQVFKDYVPSERLQQQIHVTGFDGTQLHGFAADSFDRVLVDAPCSSDRHLIRDPSELANWTRHRTKQLSQRQAALLNTALRSVVLGGRVVYSTCALSEIENDGVISKIIKRYRSKIAIIKQDWSFGEPTKFGWLVLPNTQGESWGPMYICVIKKMAELE